MTIVEFLRARYDEEWARLDELNDLQSFPQAVYWTSRAHMDQGAGPGLAVEVVAGPKSYVRFYPEQPTSTPDWGWVVNDNSRLLFSRDETARRLREVEAKRRIVDAYELALDEHDGEPGAWDWDSEYDRLRTTTLRDVVHLLALPHSDHPDYDESWHSCSLCDHWIQRNPPECHCWTCLALPGRQHMTRDTPRDA